MEDSDETVAPEEAALVLSPQVFVDEVLDIVGDVGDGAFEYCLQEVAAPGVLGAAKAAQKAAELERGLNAIHHVVMNVLDKRMTNWEKYCIQHCFTVPEGFVVPEDDNSCAKESHKDGTSDSELDVELDSLRRKLESANKESENLRREMSSLERQTACKRKLDSSIAEIQKLFEDKFVQKNFEDLAKAIPILQQKLMGMNKKMTDTGNLVDQQVWNMNGLRDKCQALDKGFTAPTEDIQEIINILQE
ncbi:protein MIS12 homolog [Phragmites australis]|uniref:protein MIS12 homolog n=1 Tax=Phragmites australis TaxID=29695 RepID=UPI002D7A2513|nr:protein MIS12 homolog [Phragmites australis]